MSENIPPAPLASSTHTPDQPGRPYYESLRTTLRSTLDKKRKLDDQLTALEDAIFKAEGTYLEETASSGNIVRGFDGWVKGVQIGGGGGGGRGDERRRGRVRDDERIFSRSSVGWMRQAENPDAGTPSTSHAATPTASFAASHTANSTRQGSAQPSVSGTSKAGNKKKRTNADKDGDEEEGKSVKRNKISYSRD
ncbi:Hypothetical protein R9X50_00548900 [Acrodontium crateriforme]|uniref:Chromatin modification-related protein EAF6 n=1 Tax=Acrodontium crateriforme TaxID=150365 RepID=A0AAQ3R959_9PEZI|nr:Hypothetical protein R9X50_00548900 [Acrodontium crateriforme]